MNSIKNFGQKNIIIVFLSLLLLGKSIFKGDWDNTIAYSIIFAVTMFYTIGLNMVMRSKMDLKNTFIITAIFLILVGSVSMGKELVILSIIALIMLSLRYFLRYKGSPIINIATLGGLIIILMGYIYSSGIFIGWGGANYNLSIGGYRLPYGTILSVLACLSVIYLSKKYLYALGFFITYAILGYGIFGIDFIEYSFLDGTLYFYFGVMVLEPKTGIYGKYQLHYGIFLGIMLLLFFKFQIPGDYFLALAIMNILSIWDKHRMNQEIKGKTYPVGQLWLCIPCGYIYDPVLGDTDSGIVAGTEFVDIPDNWRCPVCGVTKSDFIPYNGDEVVTEGAKIISKTYLNPTTIELTIETEKKHKSMPGQFVGFFWEDEEGIFQRSYSIVKQDKNQLTFTIKLDPFGRGARILEKLVIGDKIRINGVFGNFLLQNSENPKIFIATGTGLAPIYNMLLSLDSEKKKILYFSVATEGELFYVDKLKDIKNLELHIHITRENIDGYQAGRVDINSIETSPETEWYLCGNPKMVTEAIEKLQQRGFTKIFKEEF